MANVNLFTETFSIHSKIVISFKRTNFHSYVHSRELLPLQYRVRHVPKQDFLKLVLAITRIICEFFSSRRVLKAVGIWILLIEFDNFWTN